MPGQIIVSEILVRAWIVLSKIQNYFLVNPKYQDSKADRPYHKSPDKHERMTTMKVCRSSWHTYPGSIYIPTLLISVLYADQVFNIFPLCRQNKILIYGMSNKDAALQSCSLLCMRFLLELVLVGGGRYFSERWKVGNTPWATESPLFRRKRTRVKIYWQRHARNLDLFLPSE